MRSRCASRARGNECELAADAASALGIVERQSLDAVICDVRMDGMNGFELLDRVKRTHPALPFVVITGMGRINDAVDAIKRGAFQYVTKPCDVDELRAIVASAIEERRRHAVGEGDHRTSFPPALTPSLELIGNGPSMRALQTASISSPPRAAPVLVTGETGVGKELVARAIHARGARRGGPFVAVNTSAIPHNLLESEKSSGTSVEASGAVQARKGLLTEAEGGTLLLDEIGDMPIGLQSKLLRVIQFGEVRPVGGNRPHQVDVRVIASTHRDLPALIREERFREDLYFRLNVLPVFVPPLRQRREDIPALAAHLLGEACQRAPNSPVRSIGPEALHSLEGAPWPGNVRELASVIERAVVFGADEQLDIKSLSSVFEAEMPRQDVPWSFGSEGPLTLRNLSRAYTDWVLVQTGGNKERAAEILGIDLSTLYRWQRAATPKGGAITPG